VFLPQAPDYVVWVQVVCLEQHIMGMDPGRTGLLAFATRHVGRRGEGWGFGGRSGEVGRSGMRPGTAHCRMVFSFAFGRLALCLVGVVLRGPPPICVKAGGCGVG
jgi:hypothetical protein